MPRLRLQAELTPSEYAEIGHPAVGFQHHDNNIVALCSDFGLLYWPGRAIYDGHRCHHRVTLYSRSSSEPLAFFDRAKFPINDIAFHPTRPELAIGTGSYDGGYSFQGELWIWNWETEESYSILGESREVVQCRFVDDNRLAVTLRPRHEEEFDSNSEDELCVGLIIDEYRNAPDKPSKGYEDKRLVGLTPLDPRSLGFTTPPPQLNERRQRFFDAFPHADKYEERSRVWDICWLTDDQIALVHDNCLVEVWNTEGTREIHQKGKGFGVQILKANGSTLVHTVTLRRRFDDPEDYSTIYRLDSSGFVKARELESSFILSTDGEGNLLCRNSKFSKDRQTDCALDIRLNPIFTGNLGHYDCFNHFIRLDGGGLYFLRGTPPSSHKQKQLCRLTQDGSTEVVMKWDSKGSHLLESSACWGPKGSLIRSYSVYDPRQKHHSYQIQRCDMSSGQAAWTTDISSVVTSMVNIDEQVVIYALTDGTLGLIDLNNGKIIAQEHLTVGNIPSVATAISVRGTCVAVGTIDARLLLYRYQP